MTGGSFVTIDDQAIDTTSAFKHGGGLSDIDEKVIYRQRGGPPDTGLSDEESSYKDALTHFTAGGGTEDESDTGEVAHYTPSKSIYDPTS